MRLTRFNKFGFLFNNTQKVLFKKDFLVYYFIMLKQKIHQIIDFIFRINKIIWFLVSANVVAIFAFQFFAPFFAVFVTQQIEGGTLTVIGAAYSVYWVSKSIFQIPIARYLDKDHGERDEFYALVLGFFIAGLVPWGYFFASKPSHIYLVQIILGLSDSLIVPAWLSTFTRHVDKFRISFEWTLNSVGIGMAAAVAGFLGGILAQKFGFTTVLVLLSIFSFASALIILPLHRYLKPGKIEKISRVFPEKKPH